MHAIKIVNFASLWIPGMGWVLHVDVHVSSRLDDMVAEFPHADRQTGPND